MNVKNLCYKNDFGAAFVENSYNVVAHFVLQSHR